MVRTLWRWFRSWLLWHHLGFHDFGYVLHTLDYITVSFELTYRGRDMLRPLPAGIYCETCGMVKVDR